ncbi:hypothetical protein BV898_03114, partial [Hypsibius exemplaris]
MTYEEMLHLSETICNKGQTRLKRLLHILQRMEPHYADQPEKIEFDLTLQAHKLRALVQLMYQRA